MMALIHLLPLLEAAEAAGELNARFLVFPMVNPVGMANLEFGGHQGRHDRPSGVNFNRQWPDLYAAIESGLESELSDNQAANQRVIRRRIGNWVARQKPVGARQTLRHLVVQHAHDADYVFDLHCDDESLAHIFSPPHCNESMQRLSRWIDLGAIMTADDSGGGSFDEVWPLPWIKARHAFPDYPIAIPVTACTLELRGQADVSDAIGSADASGLFAYFQSEGLIAGDAGAPPFASVEPTPLNATEILRVDAPGLLSYRVNLGDHVTRGQVIADLIALHGTEAFRKRTPTMAGTDGTVINRRIHKYVWPGCSIAKIAGRDPLPERDGYLLED